MPNGTGNASVSQPAATDRWTLASWQQIWDVPVPHRSHGM